MNEVQITALLVAFVAILIGVRAYRRNTSEKRDMAEMDPPKGKAVSYETGRDEVQWRRAYSRG